MRLVEQWSRIEGELPEDWSEARLELTVSDLRLVDRAAALLGPLSPGRVGGRISFSTARGGAGPSPALVRRALAHLEDEVVKGQLRLLGAAKAEAPLAEVRRSLAGMWDEAIAKLPDDWSDLYCEVQLTSSDDFEPGALLMAPLNPGRFGDSPAFRFRVARRFGYGAAPEMARRCLERLDEAGIVGEVRILRVLSDTKPVATQGPVWYVGGRAV